MSQALRPKGAGRLPLKSRRPEVFRRVRIVRVLPLLIAVLALCASPTRARADERARLANILLAEQLADVATTQQLLHSKQCGQSTPIFNAALVEVGSYRHCVAGTEGDPLARPFVVTPVANIAAALAVNGIIRLAAGRLGWRGTRALRYGVELYPIVVIGTLRTTMRVDHFVPELSVTMERHF
jgi:hypothetical protein